MTLITKWTRSRTSLSPSSLFPLFLPSHVICFSVSVSLRQTPSFCWEKYNIVFKEHNNLVTIILELKSWISGCFPPCDLYFCSAHIFYCFVFPLAFHVSNLQHSSEASLVSCPQSYLEIEPSGINYKEDVLKRMSFLIIIKSVWSLF